MAYSLLLAELIVSIAADRPARTDTTASVAYSAIPSCFVRLFCIVVSCSSVPERDRDFDGPVDEAPGPGAPHDREPDGERPAVAPEAEALLVDQTVSVVVDAVAADLSFEPSADAAHEHDAALAA